MTYVALLRGIGPTNPNMHPAKLQRAFERMGFGSVRTVIASGNIVFESPSKDTTALERTVEMTLPKLLGFSSTTIIRSQVELTKLLKNNPFKKINGDKSLYPLVTFLKDKPKKPFQKSGKGFKVYLQSKREVCAAPERESVRAPDFMVLLEKHFGKAITSRTWKTLARIVKKMEE